VLDQLFGPTISVLARDTEEEVVLKPKPGIRPRNVVAANIVLAVTVSGRVLEETGQAVPGVNVIEKGTTNGTTTDATGRFSIEVQGESSVLVFSFIGYQTQEARVGAQTEISITLAPDITALEEVVVVGYGTQQKVNLTGAVGTATGEVLENRPIVNVG
jgi:hypothetical protein